MADITISYKGNTIAEVSESGTTTLGTSGKYCEDDISIAYVQPNPSSATDITITYGESTIAEVSASGTTTLGTKGKYCTSNILLEYVRPSIQIITDDSIYLLRQLPYNSNAKTMQKIVGCSFAWNQIAQFPNRTNISAKGITFTVSDGVLTYSGTPTASTGYIDIASGTFANFISGHKYLIRVVDSNGGVSRKCYVVINNPYAEIPSSESNAKRYAIYAPTATPTYFLWRLSLVNLATDTQISGTAWVQAFDLTMMFGSTIANYIYGLGASACLAWFQKLFDKDFYPYDAGSLVSVKPTASKMMDAYESSVSSYPLSGIELRGLPKLDANNNLYYDGDEYTADGTVKRKYEYRAYASGDESLADAITDGTHTVAKLTTPTTETTTGYTARQTCYPNGTEEFVDGRTVEIPVNAVADYEVTS